MRWVFTVLLVAGTSRADKHVVERGETLEHVAQSFGCTTEAVLHANGLTTTLVPAGTVVQVPACSIRSRARTRARSDDDKAKAALEVIDGASWIASPVEPPQAPASKDRPRLREAEHLDEGEGYLVRRPSRAYGAPHVVEHLRYAIGEVRALYPDVHTLAIGDLSAEHGGKLSAHHSHQTGLDVDVGFYFTKLPAGYPESFAAADAGIDLEATWALLTAFARTADLRTGVEIIFLDTSVQARLYKWAKAHGTPAEDLAFLLQYPREDNVGLVRHWPNHTDHMHVRFKSGRQPR